MKVGACGVCCEVCLMFTKGVCKGCCAGIDEIAPKRLEKLEKMGLLCPALKCAVDTKIGFCPKDCDKFPCETYEKGEFPYSQRFLAVQKAMKG